MASKSAAAKAKAAPGEPEQVNGRTLRRQGRETMNRLLDAGLEALAEKGFRATRVDDIVRIAGASHGTFYLYFTSKEDMFRVMAEQCAADTASLAASLGHVEPGADGLVTLKAWLAEFVALYRRYGVVIRAWNENQLTDRKLASMGTKAFASIAATLRERIPDRPGETGRAKELRSAALLAMIERFTYTITSRDLGYSDAEVVDRLAELIQRGWFRGD